MQNIILQLHESLPPVEQWIDRYLKAHRERMTPVGESGFTRLPGYFSRERLDGSKVVKTDQIDMPPLSRFGLSQFRDLESIHPTGITYKDVFFLAPQAHSCESTHFHEMVHIIQWDALNPADFLVTYAIGILIYGYEDSPLERMAYELQDAFDRGETITDLESQIISETRSIANKTI